MRLFIAIPLTPESLTRLSAAVARLRLPHDGLRWTAPESWHITLQFLGEASPQQCSSLMESLKAVKIAPFLVHIEGLGCLERAGVILVGVRPNPQLTALERQVTAATAPVGFVAESRAFRPHITLARSKGRAPQSLATVLARLPQRTDFSSLRVQEFRLLESFLEPSGARYEVRGRFPLGAAG